LSVVLGFAHTTPTPAGPHGGSSTSSITLVVLGGSSIRTASTSDQKVYFGDNVTFNVSTNATDRPYVLVECTQAGILVYQYALGFYPSFPLGQTFTMGPTRMWQSGDADCEGSLVTWTNGGKMKTLASVPFHVTG
jgi:hypothetical protein